MDRSAPGHGGVAATDRKRLNARFADRTISGTGEMTDLASGAIACRPGMTEEMVRNA